LLGGWWYQDYLLYLPNAEGRKGEQRQTQHNRPGYRTPSEYSIPFEEHYLTTRDNVRIHTWLLLQESKSIVPTIIYFHGNAGNIGYRMPLGIDLYRSLRVNVLMVEYRGYGNSQGSPSERGLNSDAQASLDFILGRSDLDHGKIFLLGQSLGGAVAIKLANTNQAKICGVIVENTFTCIEDMVIVLAERLKVKSMFLPALRFFVFFFLTSRWKSKVAVRHLTCPILFISGLADELIPPAQMQELYDSTLESRDRQLCLIMDGEHNTTYSKGAAGYIDACAKFVIKHM